MDTIIKATPLKDLKIEVLTSSGISGVFDMKPYLKGSAFKELYNESYFCLVRPAHHPTFTIHDQKQLLCQCLLMANPLIWMKVNGADQRTL